MKISVICAKEETCQQMDPLIRKLKTKIIYDIGMEQLWQFFTYSFQINVVEGKWNLFDLHLVRMSNM